MKGEVAKQLSKKVIRDLIENKRVSSSFKVGDESLNICFQCCGHDPEFMYEMRDLIIETGEEFDLESGCISFLSGVLSQACVWVMTNVDKRIYEAYTDKNIEEAIQFLHKELDQKYIDLSEKVLKSNPSPEVYSWYQGTIEKGKNILADLVCVENEADLEKVRQKYGSSNE